MQVLVDADNVHPARLAALLDALALTGFTPSQNADVRLVAIGRARALANTTWPEGAEVVPHQGWQSADIALAQAYVHEDEALVLASGDGDFVHLVRGHEGPVLVVAAERSTSGRMRDHATVVDPVHEGTARIVDWLNGLP